MCAGVYLVFALLLSMDRGYLFVLRLARYCLFLGNGKVRVLLVPIAVTITLTAGGHLRLFGTMFLYQLVPALFNRLTTQPIQSILEAFVSLLISYIIINEVIRYHARVPGMKGPPGLPLIGNLWSIRSNAAAKYYEWSQTYGDVYQVQMGNVPVVIVNSAKAARQLWVGQSQALSSRPITYTFHKVRYIRVYGGYTQGNRLSCCEKVWTHAPGLICA